MTLRDCSARGSMNNAWTLRLALLESANRLLVTEMETLQSDLVAERGINRELAERNAELVRKLNENRRNDNG